MKLNIKKMAMALTMAVGVAVAMTVRIPMTMERAPVAMAMAVTVAMAMAMPMAMAAARDANRHKRRCERKGWRIGMTTRASEMWDGVPNVPAPLCVTLPSCRRLNRKQMNGKARHVQVCPSEGFGAWPKK